MLLIASFLVFCVVQRDVRPDARSSRRRERRGRGARGDARELGLDQPLLVQYGDWLDDARPGRLRRRATAAAATSSTMVSPALWNTLQLIIWGILISAIVALFVGVYSRGRGSTRSATTCFTGLAFIGIAMPPFWFGLIAIQFFAVEARGLVQRRRAPALLRRAALGRRDRHQLDYFRHLVLPVLTLTVQIVASWSRFQRASMLDVLSRRLHPHRAGQGRAAAQGVFKHALRNALIPLVTVMALDIGALFGGLIITEQIFSIPGMGRLFVDGAAAAATRRSCSCVADRRRRLRHPVQPARRRRSTASLDPRIRLS